MIIEVDASVATFAPHPLAVSGARDSRQRSLLDRDQVEHMELAVRFHQESLEIATALQVVDQHRGAVETHCSGIAIGSEGVDSGCRSVARHRIGCSARFRSHGSFGPGDGPERFEACGGRILGRGR